MTSNVIRVSLVLYGQMDVVEPMVGRPYLNQRTNNDVGSNLNFSISLNHSAHAKKGIVTNGQPLSIFDSYKLVNTD